MIENKHLSMFVVLMLVASLAMVSVPVQSPPAPPTPVPVTFEVEMPPEGYIPGVAVNEWVYVNVSIDASTLTPNTTEGIVGWGMDVQVDPDVLMPIGAMAGLPGYLQYDFLVDYNYPIGPDDYWLKLLVASTIPEMAATGYMDDVSEFIMGDPPAGAGGTETRLVTLAFISKNATAYSPIQISLNQSGVWQANYKNATKQWTDAAVINGHYNPSPYAADLVGRSAWKEHAHFDVSKHGDALGTDAKGTPGYQTLFGKVKNTGTDNVTVKVVFELMRGEAPGPLIETDNETIAPGQKDTLDTSSLLDEDFAGLDGYPWDVPGPDEGTWEVTAYCMYHNGWYWERGAKVKTYKFNVVP